jgi:hypothetical protein
MVLAPWTGAVSKPGDFIAGRRADLKCPRYAAAPGQPGSYPDYFVELQQSPARVERLKSLLRNG